MLVTSRRVIFRGGTRKREWRWDRLPDIELDGTHVVMPVSNRQTVSAITPGDADVPSAILSSLWAFGNATGRGVSEAIDTAEQHIAEISQVLRDNPPLGPLEERTVTEAPDPTR